ncbi:Polygalacturonase, partial [Ananas comosus]
MGHLQNKLLLITLLIFFSFHNLFSRCYSTLEESSINNPYYDTANYRMDYYDSLPYQELSSGAGPTSPERAFNVDDYGARADGTTDDRDAFLKAWNATCSSSSDSAAFVIRGTLEASKDRSDWPTDEIRTHWIKFESVKNLLVQGGGTLDGNGDIWWQNSCKIDESLALYFYGCQNLRVENINLRDSQQIHMTFGYCADVEASELTITAPEWSPNTDGIHVASTTNAHIHDCSIGTGDDCISIVNGSRNIKATNIVCGPGHGISIGSLGANHSTDHVSDGGQGHAKNIIFKNINVHNVSNPIIINQDYCDSMIPCHEQKSAVAVSGILYKNIKGTSATEFALKLNCSKSVPCHDVVLQDISLEGEGGIPIHSLCRN